MPVPLLILSDAPTSGTGLGRISADLATRIHENLADVFDVGTLGYGGPMKRSLGFPQYNCDMRDWVVYNLPDVWRDFAGKKEGIVFTIWDASRMLWFARPENTEYQDLRKFLMDLPFKKWGYFPMDATGPNDKLTAILSHTIQAYDRVLGYSNWAYDILKRSLDPRDLDLDWRPHGIDTSVFYPRHYRAARNGFGERIKAKTQKGKPLVIPTDTFLIGIVATNQMRKDFGLGFQVAAEIKKYHKVIVWVHTDILERHWSLPSLVYDYGFQHDECVVTMDNFSDEQMAWCYSAADVTLGIGGGEGFGFPIFESLACGTPCIHGNYGGAPEHMPDWMIVDPYCLRMEGVYSSIRPVYRVEDWVNKIMALPKRGDTSLMPSHLDWQHLWPKWSEWLTKGIEK